MGEDLVGEPLDRGGNLRRDAGGERRAGLSTPKLETALGCGVEAADEGRSERGGQLTGIGDRLVVEGDGEPVLEDRRAKG